MIRKLSESSDFRAREMTRTRPDLGFRGGAGAAGTKKLVKNEFDFENTNFRKKAKFGTR